MSQWNIGHASIPSDRDISAYVYSYEACDIIMVRGHGDDGDFIMEGEDWPGHCLGNVVAWFDGGPAAELTVDLVQAIVAKLTSLSGSMDHIVEDWLHRTALKAVVDGHPDARAIAAAALKSRELKFSRYYD